MSIIRSMKYNEIKSLSSEERQAKLIAEAENLQRLRFAHTISPIDNPMRIQKSRRLIAQLKTAKNALKTQKIER